MIRAGKANSIKKSFRKRKSSVFYAFIRKNKVSVNPFENKKKIYILLPLATVDFFIFVSFDRVPIFCAIFFYLFDRVPMLFYIPISPSVEYSLHLSKILILKKEGSTKKLPMSATPMSR